MPKKKIESQKPLLPHLATIPKRLEIPRRKEFRDFPQNILFGTLMALSKMPFIASALYEPDLDSFEMDKGRKSMRYYNTLSGLWVVVVSKITTTWHGEKSDGENVLSTASAKSWNEFFTLLTIKGISDGEPHSPFIPKPITSPGSKLN